MCLIINTTIHPNYQSKTAEEDIYCYKVIKKNSKNEWTSIFHDRKKWELNKLYTCKTPIDRGATQIGAGYYHTFTTKIDAGCLKYQYFNPCEKAYVAKCIIPKGSKYFIGNANYVEGDSYASKKLKIVEIYD